MISVIVPVYNVEKYLKECIDSIINQTYSELEIILIDDGSTDNSGKICDEYAKNDKRIVVLHKKNGGLSEARNYGLKIAKGDCITFVDSDDIIHHNMYEIMIKEMEDTHADLVACKYTSDLQIFESLDIKNLNLFEINPIKDFNGFISNTNVVVWNKIFKKSVFIDFEFSIGHLHEDEYIHRLLFKTPNAVIVDLPLYFYRIRNNSIISIFKESKIFDALDAFEDRINFSIKNEWKELFPLALERYGSYCIEQYTKIKKMNDSKYTYILKELRQKVKKVIIKYGKKNFKKKYLYFSKGDLNYSIYLFIENLVIYISKVKHLVRRKLGYLICKK